MWFWKFCVEWLGLSFHGGEVSPCQSAKHSVRFPLFCPYIKLSFGSRLGDGGSWHYSNMLFISWSLLISPGCCCNSTISLNKLITTQDLLNMKPQNPGSTCDLGKAVPLGCSAIIFSPSVGEMVTRTSAIVARKKWLPVIESNFFQIGNIWLVPENKVIFRCWWHMPPVLLQEAVLEIWWQSLTHTDFQEMGCGDGIWTRYQK